MNINSRNRPALRRRSVNNVATDVRVTCADVELASPRAETGDEPSLFRDAVRDVEPLATEAHPLTEQGVAPLTPGQIARREAAVAQGRAEDPNYFHMRDVPQLSPHEIIDQHKDGVQYGVLKKLRHGEYPIQDALDLHRKTVLQARHELYWFLQRSLAKSLRLVLVTHGKGLGAETPARLKSHVAYWLTLAPEVVACHSAIPRHGGTGALYVLLRKSETDRIENRERHGHKGRLDHTR